MLSEISQRKTNIVRYYLSCEILKMQQTSDYNRKKKVTDSQDIKNKLVVTSGEWKRKEKGMKRRKLLCVK